MQFGLIFMVLEVILLLCKLLLSNHCLWKIKLENVLYVYDFHLWLLG